MADDLRPADDFSGGSFYSNQMNNIIDLEASSADDPQNQASSSVVDLNMMSGAGVNKMRSSVSPAFDDLTIAYRGAYRTPYHLEGLLDVQRNRNIARNSGATGDNEVMNLNSRQLRQFEAVSHLSSRTHTLQQKSDFDQRLYENHVPLSEPQLECPDRLDGRLLSLGYQSRRNIDIKSNVYGQKLSDRDNHYLSPSAARSNDSLNIVGGSLSGFQTKTDRCMSPCNYTGDLNLMRDDYGVSQALNWMNTTSVPMVPQGELNLRQFMPTPACKTSELGVHKSIHRSGNADLVNPSVLSYTHQRTTDQLQNTETGMELPINSSFSGESCREGQPGQVYPPNNVTSYAGARGRNISTNLSSHSAGQTYTPIAGHILDHTGEGATISSRNEISHPTSSSRQLLKRSRDSSSLAPIRDRQRRLRLKSGTHQHSPYLVQNAPGQVPAGATLPTFAAPVSPFQYPASVVEASAPSVPFDNRTAFPATALANEASLGAVRNFLPPASVEALVPPTQVPAARGGPMAFRTSVRRSAPVYTPALPAVPAEDSYLMLPPRVPSVPSPLPGSLAARTVLRREAAVPSSSRRVLPDTALPLPSTSSPAPVPPDFLSKTSTNAEAVAALRKSLAARVAVRKAMVTQTAPPYIKWQGFDEPQVRGLKCMLCKRDLSYTPEGPVSTPPFPPTVAVLACTHTFHDHCLQLITPKDQLKDPPCIPCAIGEN